MTKFLTSLLFAVLLFSGSLHAAQRLVVEASLKEKHAHGRAEEWKAKPITVADGKPALFRLGDHDLKVTPASLEGGRVVIPFLITRGAEKNGKLISRPTITTRPGQTVFVSTGELTFTVRVTLAP